MWRRPVVSAWTTCKGREEGCERVGGSLGCDGHRGAFSRQTATTTRHHASGE